jgi:ADP-ribose pyrophosphatase
LPEPEQPWQLVRQRQLGSSPRATLYANTYGLPDGSTRSDYFVVDERGGALVVALTDADELVLVGQYRAPAGTFTWELPAGALEAGESDAAERARAELLEETGCAARERHDAGPLLAAPHRSTETDRCVLALGADAAAEPHPDLGEAVRVWCVPLAEAERMIDTHAICSAVSIASLDKALRLRSQT